MEELRLKIHAIFAQSMYKCNMLKGQTAEYVLDRPVAAIAIAQEIRWETIGYNNWVSSLHTTGFPKNDNGTAMDCWQLYDFYINKSDKREKYYNHAKINDL